jgi:4-hydroxy-tetrahydrodipicolinate synthase
MDRPPAASPVSGVVPVVETPFDAAGAIDRRSFRRLLEQLADAGVEALMFPGFASEFYKLDEAERSLLTGDLLAVCGERQVATVVAVSDHATCHAVRRSSELADAGATAINLLPPRQPAPGAAAVLEHVEAVLDAVAPLPVVLQYAPEQAGTALGAGSLTELARRCRNLAAVKVEIDQPVALIAELLAGDPPLPSLVGRAGRQLLPALRAGAQGVQPGCSLVEVYLRVWADWHAGRREEARLLHLRLLDYLSEWTGGAEHIVAVEKLVSHRRGLIDTPECRAPAHALTDRDRDSVERCLAEFAELVA